MVVEESIGEMKGTDDMMTLQRLMCTYIKLETAITTPQLDAHEDCADLTPSIGVVASCLVGLTSCASSCDSQLWARKGVLIR